MIHDRDGGDRDVVCDTDTWRAGRTDSQYDPETDLPVPYGGVFCAEAGAAEKVSRLLA